MPKLSGSAKRKKQIKQYRAIIKGQRPRSLDQALILASEPSNDSRHGL